MAYQSEIEKLEARFREKPEQWFAALADAYRKAGDVDMALEVLGAWIDKRPKYTSGYIVRGRCLLDRGRLAEASQAFEQVLQLDMENVLALKSLAEIAERSGDTVAACGWLKRLLDVDPMNEGAREALHRLGGDKPVAEVAPPGAPEAIAAPGFSFVDLDRVESSDLTIERTSEAFDVSEMPAATDEAYDLGLPEPVEGLEFTAEEPPKDLETSEPAEAMDVSKPAAESEPVEAVEVSEPAVESGPVEPPAVVEVVEAVEAVEPPQRVVPEPVKARGDIPGPSLDLATAASDWKIPEPPSPAPKPVARPADEPVVESTVPDVEPMDFRPVEEPEPVPIEGLAPSGFDAAFEEFSAQAGPLETAAEPELGSEEDLSIIMPPEVTASPRASVSVTADDVEFVQPSAAEVEPEAAAEPVAEPEDRGELPLILPEEVSAELDEPSIREPEPVVTETMAALYSSQGLYTEARDIYRKLLARNPGNARVESLLDEVDELAAGAKSEPSSRRDRFAAGARGGLSVAQLMQALASATPEGVPLEDAGEEPSAAASGFSFDEFFSSDASPADGGDGEPGEPAPRESEGDEFRGWLDGLKT